MSTKRKEPEKFWLIRDDMNGTYLAEDWCWANRNAAVRYADRGLAMRDLWKMRADYDCSRAVCVGVTILVVAKGFRR